MRAIFILLLGSMAINAIAQKNEKFNKEQKAIAFTIQNAYEEGLQNEGDSLKIDQGFHQSFRLIGKGDQEEDLRILEIKDWRKRQIVNRKNGNLPRPENRKVSVEFEFIDVTGNAAVAKVKYFEGSEMTYIDYISLYKFESGWKMITKTYEPL